MKTIYLLAPVLLLSFFSTTSFAQASCTETLAFNWKNSSGIGVAWPITNGEASVIRTYTITGTNGTVTVKAILGNSDGQNIDLSNCGTSGNHFYTATHNDPNATADCGPGTDGQFSYGPDYLTMGMTSSNSNQKISMTFIFSYPARISDLDIWDIDYQGGGGLGSWEDELDITATFVNTAVPVKVTSAGAAVIVNGNNTTALNIRSLYGPGNGNLSPNDATGSVHLSTDALVTSFTITYSNGPNDDGISDDHAIKIGSFNFCPDFSIAPLPVTITAFEGVKQFSGTALYWSVASEKDLQTYELQASHDGNSFETITSVTPAANSNGTANYQYQHKDVFANAQSVVYYRLKIIDETGKISYSKTIYIQNAVVNGQLKMYPNPAQTGNDVILIQKNIEHVSVYTAAGVLLFNNAYNRASSIIIPGSTFNTKGILFVRINGGPAQKLIIH